MYTLIYLKLEGTAFHQILLISILDLKLADFRHNCILEIVYALKCCFHYQT